MCLVRFLLIPTLQDGHKRGVFDSLLLLGAHACQIWCFRNHFGLQVDVRPVLLGPCRLDDVIDGFSFFDDPLDLRLEANAG